MKKPTPRSILAATVIAVLFAAGTAAAQYRPYSPSGRFDRLTGTYRLDPGRSTDPSAAVDRATRGMAPADRDDVRRRLTNRVTAPRELAIERTGREVRIASSRAPEMSFDADGRDRVERGAGGRTFTTHASLATDRLDVSTRGSAGNDFSVTFESIDRGSALRVTRRLYDDRLPQ